MLESLPILLGFRIEENNLILRFDKFGLLHFEFGKLAICQLILEGYEDNESLIEDLHDLLGGVFEYEIHSQNEACALEFWGDYVRIEKVINCKLIKETFFDYLSEDLCLKGNYLATSY
jgi:hypothetical protein